MYLDKSPEYWLGWVLSYYAWLKNYRFSYILSAVSAGDRIAEKTPCGWKIKRWNYYMADCSTHLVCDIKKDAGRAGDTLRYTISKGYVKIFNIAEI